ncbi:hypothetical protein EYF80_021189 [Liparis tanakae]|uniref:Uncharacterized protein n=1 Tax=Liparis tanakae TaxID=230148 RepID=A0A4Z2HUB2_9TELE|nr:hypothetical protein EYF80_021189 [Liparis tanakae]
MVTPSSRRRKCRCFFHDLDLTFLRVDPAIITLTSESSWMPEVRVPGSGKPDSLVIAAARCYALLPPILIL